MISAWLSWITFSLTSLDSASIVALGVSDGVGDEVEIKAAEVGAKGARGRGGKATMTVKSFPTFIFVEYHRCRWLCVIEEGMEMTEKFTFRESPFNLSDVGTINDTDSIFGWFRFFSRERLLVIKR